MIIISNFGGMESDYNIRIQLMKAWKDIIIYNFGGMEEIIIYNI